MKQQKFVKNIKYLKSELERLETEIKRHDKRELELLDNLEIFDKIFRPFAPKQPNRKRAIYLRNIVSKPLMNLLRRKEFLQFIADKYQDRINYIPLG